MKIVLVIVLIVIAFYIYRRTQKVADKELQATKKQSKTLDASEQTMGEQEMDIKESGDVDTAPLVETLAAPEVNTEITTQTAAEPMTEVNEPKPDDSCDIDTSAASAGNLVLAPVTGAWASETFLKLVAGFPSDGDAQAQHQSLGDVIGHCYKLRKQSDYCLYGAALASSYQRVFVNFRDWQQAMQLPLDVKGVVFMQLTSLLNDTEQFDQAITLCQQAMDYQLDDGTITGFAGRLARIEKAKMKAKK